jgi:hypothetical protein
MIFRWLYKRRLTKIFGQFMTEEDLAKLVAPGEWNNFLLLLPEPIRRAIRKPAMSERQALFLMTQEIHRVLIEAKKKQTAPEPGPEHQARLKVNGKAP